MAFKSTLFLLAFVLFVTRMGSCVDQELNNMTISNKLHDAHCLTNPPARAPVQPPSAVPVQAPSTTPVPTPTHAPTVPPVHAPSTFPAYAPSNSPAYPYPRNPVSPRASPPRVCVSMCSSYCKSTSPKRPCMGSCTACCARKKCVPGFNYNCNWDTVIFRGHLVKCP